MNRTIDENKDRVPGADERAAADEGALTRAFEGQRPRLRRVAYAITGSLAEAEDCVQEAWLRLRRAEDRHAIRDPRAWLTSVEDLDPDRASLGGTSLGLRAAS
ncbi:sigma factor [Sorangium sp. So ce1504]|uniref:sigma factor n=1 Tax=Sorangium sp. So ce1504 TaxID=3133337 RepID=UPI003F647EEA